MPVTGSSHHRGSGGGGKGNLIPACSNRWVGIEWNPSQIADLVEADPEKGMVLDCVVGAADNHRSCFGGNTSTFHVATSQMTFLV